MTYLPDVNVWIALAPERHTHHRAARHWFSNLQDEKLAFCRLTQLGFLRLLTNKHVMEEEVSQMRPGRRIASCDRTGESATCQSRTNSPKRGRRSRRVPLSSPNLWTDAYLCAFAHAGRLTVD